MQVKLRGSHGSMLKNGWLHNLQIQFRDTAELDTVPKQPLSNLLLRKKYCAADEAEASFAAAQQKEASE